ncbi:hypothetical protein [Taibaiella soli]|uniref:Uncharacterized protein n=1 Tax=Taibaiella soli TaxID=1649169 RepID=A0A2W2BMR6_9BACT|nr:hypothetical protein [Taibaiella soli]PZF74746.1 hypothetical protein DN068_00680 [Taibaiella soli]
MVRITDNKLIIELESNFPALLLRDLQESLITVLKRYNEDRNEDRLYDVNCLTLLQAMLPEPEDLERAYDIKA